MGTEILPIYQLEKEFTTLEDMFEFMHEGVRSVFAMFDAPDDNPAPFYFFHMKMPDGSFGVAAMAAFEDEGDKYKNNARVRSMLQQLGTDCTLIGFVSSAWLRTAKKDDITGDFEMENGSNKEAVVFMIETRAGPSMLSSYEILRTATAPPVMAEKPLYKEVSPDPTRGVLGNLFHLTEKPTDVKEKAHKPH